MREMRKMWMNTKMLAAVVVLLAACSDGDGPGVGGGIGGATLGELCDIGVNSVSDPTLTLLNPAASECSSKICLLPAQERTTDTKSLCTSACDSDDDCAKGQRRSTAVAGDVRCRTEFVCRRLIPKLESNPLSCKPLCVCKDFLLVDDPNARPPSCS